MRQVKDLNEEIRKLKDEGVSLRKIAATLHLSHEAVRKRLKKLASKERVSTNERNQELTALATEGEKVSTSKNARKSGISWQVSDTVNRMSTSKPPSHTLGESVNSSGAPSDRLPDCTKGVFQGVCLESEDLAAAIQQFLQTNGVEVYEMATSVEGFQARQGNQTIRFYIQREQ